VHRNAASPRQKLVFAIRRWYRIHDAALIRAAVQTLTSALVEAANRWPDRGISVRPDRRHIERRCYPEILAAAQLAAGRLAALGIMPGDNVILALPTSWALVDLWFGVLLRGAAPVVAAPAIPLSASAASVSRLGFIGTQLGAALLIAADETADYRMRVITPDRLNSTAPVAWQMHAAKADSIAFLQLTSGTEGMPRAAAISHRAVMYNATALHAACDPAIDRVVSWLPLHHDMGLVGSLLLALITGCDLVLLAPHVFLAWPDLWFSHIAEGGNVLSLAPNFALQLCRDRRDRITRGRDLSGWRALVCGGEMLRADTLSGFAELCGISASVLRPGYGLAEATLAVTVDRVGCGPRTQAAPAHARRRFTLSDIVCVGAPLPGTEVIAADSGGNRLPDGEEGEVLVRGPGLHSGYVGDPAPSPNGWLQTGDLGFVEAGELYITGRRRETLNLRGALLAPHELEQIAEAVTKGGGRCRAAAFSIATNASGEQAILAVETDAGGAETLAAMRVAIREQVAVQLGVQLHDLVFLRHGRLPRTTSGKLRRNAAREDYLSGRLEPIG
jgi:acyl-CoA synthetase (AMP-forming)/AMP-acid ligase II